MTIPAAGFDECRPGVARNAPPQKEEGRVIHAL